MRSMYRLMYVPLLLLIGCAPYVGGYYYEPHPALLQVPSTQPSQPPVVAAMASVVGIRYQDDSVHIPQSVEIRLRLDNNGYEPLYFDPRSMDLSTGDLVRFQPALVSPPQPLTLEPGQSAWFTANFPFPPGTYYAQFDLTSLQLRWSMQLGAKSQDFVADFRRNIYSSPYYGPSYAPYPYPYPIFGGVVVVRHRW